MQLFYVAFKIFRFAFRLNVHRAFSTFSCPMRACIRVYNIQVVVYFNFTNPYAALGSIIVRTRICSYCTANILYAIIILLAYCFFITITHVHSLTLTYTLNQIQKYKIDIVKTCASLQPTPKTQVTYRHKHTHTHNLWTNCYLNFGYIIRYV